MAEFPFYEPEKVLRRNLATNPALKVNSDNWAQSLNADGMEFGRTTGGKIGDYCFYITTTGVPASSGGLYYRDSGINGKAGDVRSFGAWVKWTEGVKMRAALSARKGYNNVSSSYGDTYIGTGDWQWIVSENLVITGDYDYVQMWCQMTPAGVPVEQYMDGVLAVEGATVGSYFDGDTPPSGDKRYRWLPDGTSEEYTPAKNTDQLSGVAEVSFATKERLGLVADVNVRTREKIPLELSGMSERLIAGQRVTLAAAAQYTGELVWRWVQVSGEPVEIARSGNTATFIAPDVDAASPLRVAVSASSPTGGVRTRWGYFDLVIEPPPARYRSEGGDYRPKMPHLVGYERQKREVWNDVVAPVHMCERPRREPELVDIGALPDDVQFDSDFPASAPADGVFVLLSEDETLNGTVYRNIGDAYNESDDSFAAPRRGAFWVNPATGMVMKWVEE